MNTFQKPLAAFLWCLFLVGVAVADVRSLRVHPQSKFSCYCKCEAREKKHSCTKMCELPKYEKRRWATSCHKRAQQPAQNDRESHPHPAQDDGPELARR